MCWKTAPLMRPPLSATACSSPCVRRKLKSYRPEALTAEESDARMAEIFKVWGLDYA